MRKRKTIDEYNIMGLYSYGWETVTTEENFLEARQRLKEYKENENTLFKIVKKRVKIEEKNEN